MSWKQQTGNRSNLNVNNLNAKGGYWNYKNLKFYHKNLNFSTSVGIGTSEPFSRLSLGNYENFREEGVLGGNQTIALNETVEGKKGTGIGYWYNRIDGENETHGIKFIVANSDIQNINDETTNVKLYITNNGRFFFNRKTTEFQDNNATLDVNGSMNLSETITIGKPLADSTIESKIGTIKFDKEEELGGFKIKTNTGAEGWSTVQLASSGEINYKWEKNINNNIYYEKKVSVGQDQTQHNQMVDATQAAFSVLGNTIIGSQSALTNNYNYGGGLNDASGVLIVSKNITINPPATPLFGIDSANVLLDINVDSSAPKNLIKAGNDLTFSGSHHSCLFGSSSSIDASDYTIGSMSDNSLIINSDYSCVIGKSCRIGDGNNNKYNFTLGNENTIKASNNFMVGENNNSESSDSTIFGNQNIIYSSISDVNLIIGRQNKIIDIVGSQKSKSSGYILGNNNQIKTNSSNANLSSAVCEAKIIGDSNCCDISYNRSQESIIIGNNNKILDTTYVMGDLNYNENKDDLEDLSNNLLPKFIIGNYIKNKYPYSHASFMTDNRLYLSRTTENDRKKQPPLLLTVGEGKNINGDFDSNSGSFSIDVSGNVRCTNIIMNKPNTGLLRCETVDTKKLLSDGIEIEKFNEYVLTMQFDTNPSISTFYNPILKLPYNGKLKRIISVLKLPHFNYNNTASNSLIINLKKPDGTAFHTIEHSVLSTTTSGDRTLPINWSAVTILTGQDTIDINDNIVKIYDDLDIYVDDRILMEIPGDNRQTGYTNQTNLFTTLTFVIEKQKENAEVKGSSYQQQ